jgi:hypothetical protein
VEVQRPYRPGVIDEHARSAGEHRPAGTEGRTGPEAEEESCSQLECSWF